MTLRNCEITFIEHDWHGKWIDSNFKRFQTEHVSVLVEKMLANGFLSFCYSVACISTTNRRSAKTIIKTLCVHLRITMLSKTSNRKHIHINSNTFLGTKCFLSTQRKTRCSEVADPVCVNLLPLKCFPSHCRFYRTK